MKYLLMYAALVLSFTIGDNAKAETKMMFDYATGKYEYITINKHSNAAFNHSTGTYSTVTRNINLNSNSATIFDYSTGKFKFVDIPR